MSDASEFLEYFQQDPVGAYQALGATLAEAGLVNTQATADDLMAYDNAVAEVCAANPDIDERRLHQYVAATDGNFEQAVSLYRSDTALLLQELGVGTAAQPQPNPTPGGYRGQEGLHHAIELAAAQMLRRR
jgi:hypothetical protein